MACSLLMTRAFLQTTLASHSSINNNNKNQNPKPHRLINGSPSSSSSSKSQRKQPSIAQVQRAVGITEDPLGINNSSNSSAVATNSFLDLLSSTPIGQIESSTERKIRDVAEYARAGKQILLVMCDAGASMLTESPLASGRMCQGLDQLTEATGRNIFYDNRIGDSRHFVLCSTTSISQPSPRSSPHAFNEVTDS